MSSEEFHTEEKNGKFIFIVKGCFLCSEYMKELKKHRVDTSDWYLITCDEDEDYYYRHQYLDKMPNTRIYKNNFVMWEQGGVLYKKQLQELVGYKI